MKKILLFSIPTSICNFRCHYCYLAQRPIHYEGKQTVYKYTPEQVARAFSIKRMGGPCYMNFCADGETLLTKDIDVYVKALVEQGHYAEVVTNLTATSQLEKFLSWEPELLRRLEFKCSFHYLELKAHKMLERFADNVHKIWAAGASANIELGPSDELIPYIDEVKEFSLKNFGAYPHLTILRNDNSKDIDYLTKLSREEYDKIWGSFDSAFWRFKKSIFKVKQKSFCYAGAWSAYISLATGHASGCYGQGDLGDVIANPDKPFPEMPVGRCKFAHCYNGHALLSMGVIPGHNDVGYGDLRDRVKEDGGHWLQPGLHAFFNEKLENSNVELSATGRGVVSVKKAALRLARWPRKVISKIERHLQKS